MRGPGWSSDLGDIAENQKKKKTNGESVNHLASHVKLNTGPAVVLLGDNVLFHPQLLPATSPSRALAACQNHLQALPRPSSEVRCVRVPALLAL